MPVGCCLLKNYHVMFSPFDPHMATLPPPAPPAVLPHIVTPTPLCLGPWGILTGKPVPTVLTELGIVLNKGTDIGPLIPHIPLGPNLTIALVILGSASKSYFGPATVQAGGSSVAVAAAMVMNPNMNCAFPCPVPLGIVISMNTVSAGMTLGDYMSGLVTLLIEGVIQTFLNLVFGGQASNPVTGLMEQLNAKVLGSIGGTLASETAKGVIPMVIGLVLGSPLGASGSNIYAAVGKLFGATSADDPNSVLGSGVLSPVGAGASGMAGDAGNAAQKFFDSPGVEQHP
jgi:hypothetical protein